MRSGTRTIGKFHEGSCKKRRVRKGGRADRVVDNEV